MMSRSCLLPADSMDWSNLALSRGSDETFRIFCDTPPLSALSSYPMPGSCLHRLKSCSSLVRPTLQAQCRQSSTHVPGRILRGDDLGPTREDAHQTFRVRQDETAKELPLSPLLDPVILGQRSRFEQRKEHPRVAEFTPFQKKLWENPFGRQLQCAPVQTMRY